MINSKPNNLFQTSNQHPNSNYLPIINQKELLKDQLTEETNNIKKEINTTDLNFEEEEEGGEDEEGEEEENEQEDNEKDNNNHNSSEIDCKHKESEYIAHIEELENELQIEKQITKTIQSDPIIEKEILNLRKELEEKTIKVTKLKATNKRQQQALSTLEKELESQIEKGNSINHYPSKHQNKMTKKLKVKVDPVDILLKVKDKELNNALTLIDMLSKDNDQMKSILYSSLDYYSKMEIIDNGKIKKDQLSKINKEIQLLTKQLEEHKTCKLITKDYNFNLRIIQSELKETKSEHTYLKKRLNDLEFNQKQISALYLAEKLTPSSKHKKKNKEISSVNTSNIIEKRNNTESRSQAKIKNISINSTPQLKLFSQEERKELKSKFSNIEEYEEFMNKINQMEKYKTALEPKHKNEIRQITTKIEELEKQIDRLNEKCKENESQNRIYTFQINESKNNQKMLQKRWNEFQKQLDGIRNVTKEKEQEIKLLTHQLNSLRKIVKHENINPSECEISKYIDKIQKETEDQMDETEEEVEKEDNGNSNIDYNN